MLSTNTWKNNIGIGGYDPVSYFEVIQYVPSKGLQTFSSLYNKVNYYFRNNTNKQLFDKNPEKYVPQYGWYCATAVSEWVTAPIDPYTFVVDDDRLYLFYNDITGNNTLRDRNSNVTNRKQSANTLWSTWKVKNTWWGIVYSSVWLWFKNLLT